MKAIFEFDLSDLGDKERFDECMRASNYFAALLEMSEYLRGQEKYHEEKDWPSLSDIRKRFYQICEERDVGDL